MSDDECPEEHTYGYVAIPVVLTLSILGSLTPTLLQRYRPHWNILHQPIFKFCQGLAGGFVISVALVHSFAESVELLGSESVVPDYLPEYAWGGFFALLGILATWSVELFITVYLAHKRQQKIATNSIESPLEHKFPLELKQQLSMSEFPLSSGPEIKQAIASTQDIEATSHQSHSEEEGEHGSCPSDQLALLLTHEQRVTHYSTLMILLFGLTFHSVFVGFAIGLSDDQALFIAILAHQFFEALALGSHIVRAQIRDFWFVLLTIGTFSLSCPVGTGIGIGISESICSEPSTFEVVDGVFNSLAAGILIYVGTVHMISEEFKRSEITNNWMMALLVWAGVLIGAGLMAMLGIWA